MHLTCGRLSVKEVAVYVYEHVFGRSHRGLTGDRSFMSLVGLSVVLTMSLVGLSVVLLHCKKSVDFTLKYLETSC